MDKAFVVEGRQTYSRLDFHGRGKYGGTHLNYKFSCLCKQGTFQTVAHNHEKCVWLTRTFHIVKQINTSANPNIL